MTPLALAMLVFSLVLVWGGLAVAIINLRKNPMPYSDEL